MQSEDVQEERQRYFVIKQGDRYYIALAVLEYDPKKAERDPLKKENIDKLIEIFNAATKPPGRATTASLTAAAIDGDIPSSLGCMNTGL